MVEIGIVRVKPKPRDGAPWAREEQKGVTPLTFGLASMTCTHRLYSRFTHWSLLFGRLYETHFMFKFSHFWPPFPP